VVALEKATRLLPSSPLAWKHLAEAYQATGRGADANMPRLARRNWVPPRPEQRRKRRNASQVVRL